MSNPGNLLVIGGFTESRRILEPVAEAATTQSIRDAEVLTLREALHMDDERLRRLVADADVLTHSAGVSALPDARSRASDAELPHNVMIIAGPEPRSMNMLRRAAAKKTLSHMFASTPHLRRNHLSVVAANAAELIAHPFANQGLVPAISKFSTFDAMLFRRIEAQSRVGSFMMKGDIFYPPYPDWRNMTAIQDLMSAHIIIEELPGSHDELLVDPRGVFRSMGQAIEASTQRRMFGR